MTKISRRGKSCNDALVRSVLIGLLRLRPLRAARGRHQQIADVDDSLQFAHAVEEVQDVVVASVGLEVEGHAYEKLRDSEDYKEGIAAFSAKRKPQFKA